jgi:hypothetical protein
MSTTSEHISCAVRYFALGEDRRDANPRYRDLIPNGARLETSLHNRETYSYGRHFPLYRYVPAKRGRGGLFVINGDEWRGGWTITPRHQDETRTAIATAIEDAAKLGIHITSIIIPFSALDGAQIDRDSIRPIHVREDRFEVFTETCEVPAASLARPLPTREECETASRATDPNGKAILGSQMLGTFDVTVTKTSHDTGASETYMRRAKLTRAITYLGYDHMIRRTAESGATLYGGYRDYAAENDGAPNVKTWLDGSENPTIEVTGDVAKLTWQSRRHWLGDSLFMADRVTTDRGTFDTKRRRFRFVSSFDYQEPGNLYFLAALPRTSRATSVETAIQDLAPAAVHAALARGRDVRRQGDVFFIATSETDESLAARGARRARLTMDTRAAKPRKGEVGYRPNPNAKTRAKMARERRREYLRLRAGQHAATAAPKTPSGWRRERRAKRREILAAIERHTRRIADGENVHSHGTCKHYAQYGQGESCGACGLPIWNHGYHVENAKRGLARENERLAEWSRVSRNRDTGYCSRKPTAEKYGKCYCRALNAWQSASQNVADRYTWRLTNEYLTALREVLAIHGTGHTATEVAVCRDGATYARGIVRHVPRIAGERRDSDHVALALAPDTWYLAIRNTVPRQ